MDIHQTDGNLSLYNCRWFMVIIIYEMLGCVTGGNLKTNT